MALEQELRADGKNQKKSAPVHPSKQLLNLLTLLRERVKAEAVFPTMKRGETFVCFPIASMLKMREKEKRFLLTIWATIY